MASTVSFCYMNLWLPHHPNEGYEIYRIIFGVTTMIIWCYQIGEEIVQMYVQGKDYFKELANYNDLANILLTFLLISSNIPNEPITSYYTQCVLSALNSFCLTLKLFDWMKLFQNTAFYVELIRQTINDIGPFICLFVMSLLGFGLPLSLLDFSSYRGGEVIENHVNFSPFNFMFS